ncbi:MAG: hypothetical protein WCL54_08390 [Clostridia bacterium]
MNQPPNNLNELLHGYSQEDEEGQVQSFPSDDDYFLDQEYRNWLATLDTDYLEDMLDVPMEELKKP